MKLVDIPEIGFKGELHESMLKHEGWEGNTYKGNVVHLIERNYREDIGPVIDHIIEKPMEIKDCFVLRGTKVSGITVETKERGLAILFKSKTIGVKFVNQHIICVKSYMIQCEFHNCYIEDADFSGGIIGGKFIGGEVFLSKYENGLYEFSGNFKTMNDVMPSFKGSKIIVNGVHADPDNGTIDYKSSIIGGGTNWEFLDGLAIRFTVADFIVRVRVEGREVPMIFDMIAKNMDDIAATLNTVHSDEYRKIVADILGGSVKLTYELKKMVTNACEQERVVEDRLMKKYTRLFRIESQLRARVSRLPATD